MSLPANVVVGSFALMVLLLALPQIGDEVIIIAYKFVTEDAIADHKPKIAFCK